MLGRRVGLSLSVLLMLGVGCGSSDETTGPARGSQGSDDADSDETQPDPESLAQLIDPTGFSVVRARQDRGDRTFALLERDLIRAGWAEIAPSPHSEAFSAAFDGLLAACIRSDHPIRCAGEISPNLGTLAATTGDNGSSWSVAVVQDGAVIARRSLVALSLHGQDDSRLAEPSLEVRNLDSDPRLELVVEMPVHALRDDLLLEDRDEERGAVTYVLDERLNVQARWTSMWLVVYGDPEADPSNDACTVTHRAGDGGLIFRTVCNDEEEESLTCAYEAEDDRFACPPTFADQLFRPYVSLATHYVGEDEEALLRALPGFSSRVQNVMRLAGMIGAANEAAPPPP